MICYLDKTFCPFSECAQFAFCPSAYSDEVKADAVKRMGEQAPVSLYVDAPGCFVVKGEAFSEG